jgi:hypothetical protein
LRENGETLGHLDNLSNNHLMGGFPLSYQPVSILTTVENAQNQAKGLLTQVETMLDLLLG